MVSYCIRLEQMSSSLTDIILGCVNALSWAKSGALLASGSDDTNICINSYQPQHSDAQFRLNTTIATGHRANIFSVKFMPHSSDHIVISAAGDAEIRIFDLEYAGQSTGSSERSAHASSARFQGLLNNGVRCLSEADTNARVYRSHSDRVKRLVTESSPFLFLSCSEDGEVRQWDLRQPSSAYPRPSGSRGFSGAETEGETPPPLISYKRHQLDLNSISCSPSQPHYIALGGAHLHCFLHDRRMLGRDVMRERGQKGRSSSSTSPNAHEDALSEATQCVRRFAPQGQQKMKRNQTGHVTALKISDANPNEMIASWSSDWIYNFDLVRSPDAREPGNRHDSGSRERRRKRRPAGSSLSQEGAARARTKAQAVPSRIAPSDAGTDPMALRIRYENGQTESIPLVGDTAGEASSSVGPRTSRSDEDKRSLLVAKQSVAIRKEIFSLEDANKASDDDHGTSFSNAQDVCARILPIMDDIMRTWRYPVNPEDLDVVFQNTLRSNRDRARRFVQASGTLSRMLSLRTSPPAPDVREVVSRNFSDIHSASFEKFIEDPSEKFCYDFLKAIMLWLDSGVGGLTRGFASANAHQPGSRNPLPEDASVESIDELLIPYLLSLARDRAIPNVDASRFQLDASRTLFSSERAGVVTFGRAIKIPFADLAGAAVGETGPESEAVRVQDRKAALRYWGLRVARGVLLNAGEGVTFSFCDRAFGGLGRVTRDVRSDERDLERQLEDIDPETTEPAIESVGIRPNTPRATVQDAEDSDEEMVHIDDIHDAMVEAEEAASEDNEDEDADQDSIANDRHDDERDDEDEDSNADSDSATSEDENNEDPTAHLFRHAFTRSTHRTHVQAHTPCVPAQLHYRGHANVRTVKDVNFYGLCDEYVVSGSDSGHLFIWDRASGQLLNILEGDGEVVNVVQGHPYEPMLAVSGIDHTVKIFSPDGRARHNARRGKGMCNTDASGFSSLRMGGRNPAGAGRRPQPPRDDGDTGMSANAVWRVDTGASSDEDGEVMIAPNGLTSRRRMHQEYQITSQNDVDRRGAEGARGGAFITRSMLAQLAARVQMRRRAGGGDGDGEDGEGEELEVDEDGMPVVNLGDGRVVVAPECNVQ